MMNSQTTNYGNLQFTESLYHKCQGGGLDGTLFLVGGFNPSEK